MSAAARWLPLPNPRTRLVLWIVTLGGLGALLVATQLPQPQIDLIHFSFWVALTLFASYPVRLRTGITITTSTAALFGAMFDPHIVGLLPGLLIAYFGTIEMRDVQGTVPWYGTLTNRSQYALCYLVGWLGMSLGYALPLPAGPVQTVAALLLAGAGFLTTNLTASMFVAANRQELSYRQVWQVSMRPLLPSLLVQVPLGWIMAQLSAFVGLWGVLLVFGEALLARFSFNQYATQHDEKSRLAGAEAVSSVADAILELEDPQVLLSSLVLSMRHKLNARAVAVSLYDPTTDLFLTEVQGSPLDDPQTVARAELSYLREAPSVPRITKLDQRCGIHVALLFGGEVGGVLSVFTHVKEELEDPGFQQTVLTIARFISVGKDKADLVAQLQKLALTDGLTSLPNRTVLNERMEQSLKLARRQSSSFALLAMDLNRFKELNDTLGHGAGDELLRQIGPRFLARLRDSDTLARLGGDEFSILLPDTDAAGAATVAATLVSDLERPFLIEGHTVFVGTSIGIAVYPEHGEEAETLRRRADTAMYAAKRLGGGFSLYQEGAETRTTTEQLDLLSELRTAIQEEQLVLHYQPTIDITTGQVIGVEALVRWQHPTQGLIAPDRFIPLAERSGLSAVLSRWILQRGFTQAASWDNQGQKLRVNLNLSKGTLLAADTPELLKQLLTQSGAKAEMISLEFTESAISGDPERALANATALRGLGFRLALDDFGTGHSSLTRLRQFPVQEVKVDREFVRSALTDETSRSIVRAIVYLARALNLDAVGEGVEDERTLAMLTELGCSAAQGYYIGRAVSAESVVAMVAEINMRLAPAGIQNPQPR